jgi:hypothetical protein
MNIPNYNSINEMSQLHLVGEAPNAVAISHGQHHGFSFFSGMAREVAVL